MEYYCVSPEFPCFSVKGAGGEIILYRTKDGRTTVDVMGRIISERSITGIEADDLLRVIMDYNWSIA